MSQALYRKYRSKTLSEIVGQKHITDTLSNAIKTGKISHAYLFTGPKGVGKTSIARILAHEVNGLPYTDESIHLDIIEIDAASNRRIDEIRDLRDKVHIAPTSAKYKVYIIDEVHMLTKEAFNALLKTLEEPPAHVIFILATTEMHKLPETIVSRTQRFTFKAIEPAQAVAHLRELADKEHMTITDDALELLAQHGGGSFRDAISLLDQIGHSKAKVTRADVEAQIGLAPAESITALLDTIYESSAADIVARLDGFTEQGIAPAQIAKQLASLVRQRILERVHAELVVQYTNLLGELLTVAASPNPSMALEITLFGANLTTQPVTASAPQAPTATAPTKPVAPVKAAAPSPTPTQKAAPKPTPAKAEPVAQESGTKTPPKIIQNTEDVSAWWPQLVNDIKKHNNTLYGVLRMAHPSLAGNTLQLGFAFGFHAKKILDPSTRAKLQDMVKELTGRDVAIEAVHNTELKGVEVSLAAVAVEPAPIVEATQNPAPQPAADLGAITSIFGGGEVLES